MKSGTFSVEFSVVRRVDSRSAVPCLRRNLDMPKEGRVLRKEEGPPGSDFD